MEQIFYGLRHKQTSKLVGYYSNDANGTAYVQFNIDCENVWLVTTWNIAEQARIVGDAWYNGIVNYYQDDELEVVEVTVTY